MDKKIKGTFVVKSILFIFFFSLNLFADDIVIDEINVLDKKSEDVSSKVNNKDIENEQAFELKDIFKNEKEVVVGGGISSAQKIYFRGIEDTQLNVSIDGARQTSYLFHHQGRLNLDPELFQSLEVKGTSALSGPGALSGSLKIKLKDPSDYLSTDKNFGGFFKLKGDSVSSGSGESLGLMGKEKHFEYLLILNNEDHQNYKAGGGDTVKYSSVRPQSLLSKIIFKRNSFEKFSLSFDQKENKGKRRLRNHFGEMPGDANPPSKQEFRTNNLSLNYDYSGESSYLNPHADIFISKQYLKRFGDTSNSLVLWDTVGSDVHNLFVFKNAVYTFGFDTTFDKSYAKSSMSNREEGSILGIYQDYTHSVSSYEFGLGTRYDKYTLKDPFKNKYNQDHLSFSFKTSKSYQKYFKTTASYSESFKGLTPMEATLIGNAKGAEEPTEKLKGTTGETIELLNSFKKDNYFLDLNLFRTELKNMSDATVARGGSGLIKRVNGKTLKTEGFSIEYGHHYKTHHYKGNFTHQKVSYDGNPLGYMAFNKGSSSGDRFNFSYEKFFLGRAFSFKISSLFVFPMDNVPHNQKEHKGYEVFDLYTNYNYKKKHKFGFAVTNLLDREYIAHSTPYIVSGSETTLKEPGRSFKLSYGYYF